MYLDEVRNVEDFIKKYSFSEEITLLSRYFCDFCLEYPHSKLNLYSFCGILKGVFDISFKRSEINSGEFCEIIEKNIEKKVQKKKKPSKKWEYLLSKGDFIGKYLKYSPIKHRANISSLYKRFISFSKISESFITLDDFTKYLQESGHIKDGMYIKK